MSPKPEYLMKTRKKCELTQDDMSTFMGMSKSAYADLEKGRSEVRGIHAIAADRVSLLMAVMKKNPMMANDGIRREALKLAEMINGKPD